MHKNNLFLPIFFVIFALAAAVNIARPTIQAQSNYDYFIPIFANDSNIKGFSSVGPDGGTITAIEIDPTDSNIIYAGSWGHGIYKSVNGGQNWEHQSNGFRAGFVFDIAIDPSDPQHLLASAYRFGAYESFNGGETWNSTSGMPPETVVYSFAFDPDDPDIVYAAVRLETIYTPAPHYPGAVFKSNNGGSRWDNFSIGLPDDYVYDVAIDPNNSQVLYTAMHKTGVYKSINGAVSWFSVNNDIHYKDVRSLDFNPKNSTIYAAMYDGKGVDYSTNGGASWTKIDSSMSQNLSVYSLQLDPHDQKSLYLNTPDGLYRCQGNPYPSKYSTCEKIAHDNNYVFALALDKKSAESTGKIQKLYTGLQTNGLFKSIDGGTSFSSSYKGLKSSVVLSILNDPETPSVIYASVLGRGVFKSINTGQSWRALRNGMSSLNINNLIFRPGNSAVIYAATQNDGIFISTDGGESWSPRNKGLSFSELGIENAPQGGVESGFDHPSYAWMDQVDLETMRIPSDWEVEFSALSQYPEILTLQINPDNPSQMIAGTAGYGLVKSDDFGQTWQSTGLPIGDVYDSIVETDLPPYVYYIGVSDEGIRASDNNRFSWPVVNTGFHLGADVFALARAASGNYFAASDRGIYRTNSAGSTWVYSGLPDLLINDVFVDPDKPGEIWAASSDGLFRSLDGGKNWRVVGFFNLNDQFITIAKSYGEDTLYFGMSGGNIFKIEK